MKKNEKMTVKDGLEEKYKSYVEVNQDSYGHGVVVAGSAVGKLLDEGKTPEEAEEGMNGKNLTGFMAGAVAGVINYFHPRGEEFNKWWNKDNGGTGEEKGTINPAILTVKEKEE